DTIQSIISDPPQRPRDIVPELDERLETIILKSLAKNPDERFQTAAELQRALEQVATVLGVRVDEGEVARALTEMFPGVEEQRAARLRRASDEVESILVTDDADPIVAYEPTRVESAARALSAPQSPAKGIEQALVDSGAPAAAVGSAASSDA